MASAARRALCVDGAVSVPAAASLWCAPVQLATPSLPAGVASDHLTSWRVTAGKYEAVDPASPQTVGAAGWTPLAPPTRVEGLAFEFTSPLPPTSADTRVTLPTTTPGTMHAIASWAVLGVGGGERLATGGWKGDGVVEGERAPSFRTALQWVAPVAVAEGSVVELSASHDTYGVSFKVVGAAAASVLPPAASAARAAAADVAAALSSAAAASPLAFRAIATAAAAVGARPADWGLDAGAAGGVCGRLFS